MKCLKRDEWDRVVALPRHKFVTGATLLQLNLHVNLLKTKVVIFRNRGNIKSEEKWYLNGESIEKRKNSLFTLQTFHYNYY
jgi:hypothetical protein